jgi:glycosyltransferase involved in cell wall biosynthesis
MRALHIYSGNLYGGIETILACVATFAGTPPQRVAHEFALCFDGRLAREIAATGGTIHMLGPARVSRPHTVRAARRSLAELLARRRFDWVICHAPWAQAIFGGVVRGAGSPLVFWAHDLASGRHWTERIARRAVPDLVVANSEGTAASIRALYPAAPTSVVHAPLDLRHREPDPDERRTLRAAFHTDDSAVVVVQASRSERWKGHEALIDALGTLAHVPGWVWWQVGGAQRPAERAYLAALRERAVAAGVADRIRWLGERRDVSRVLAAADIHCQANLSPEPFGMAFVEALGAGLPVVTFAMGGALEIVDDSCGVLVPPGDTAALADALARLMTDGGLRRKLGGAAPARARKLCDPVSQMQQLEQALQSLATATVRA